ncbi:uncharacterized protein LOC128395629 [Panonychus citri]|uniref:uncharacterized protein LOC128395629 n=1 Tax=Panonychus citri TaxID=50023 RepID=UPI002307429E|nr:uncharacterized protein LOC128395629 [Panonychus citri]
MRLNQLTNWFIFPSILSLIVAPFKTVNCYQSDPPIDEFDCSISSDCISCEGNYLSNGCNWIDDSCVQSNRTESMINSCFQIESFSPLVALTDSTIHLKILVSGITLNPFRHQVMVRLSPGGDCTFEYMLEREISCQPLSPRVGSYFITITLSDNRYPNQLLAQSNTIFVISESPTTILPSTNFVNRIEINLFYIVSGILVLTLFLLMVAAVRGQTGSSRSFQKFRRDGFNSGYRSSSTTSFTSHKDFDQPNHVNRPHVPLAHRVQRNPYFPKSSTNQSFGPSTVQFTGYSTTTSANPIIMSEIKSVNTTNPTKLFFDANLKRLNDQVKSKQVTTPSTATGTNVEPSGISNYFEIKPQTNRISKAAPSNFKRS